MIQDAVAVINNDEVIELVASTFSASAESLHSDLIEASNGEISKAVLGQTLTTEAGQKGSYSLGQVHAEVRADLVAQDKRLVTTAFNLLFKWVTELNLPGAKPPKFRFFEEENVQKDRADRDEALTRQGVRLSRSYYLQTYNLDESDIEKVKPPAAPADTPEAKPGPEFADRAAETNPAEVIDAITEKAIPDIDLAPAIDPVKALLAECSTLAEFRSGSGN